MKVLKKMLLINWHYIEKELIEFENINFLTGRNGAGKSTIIDALQLLMLGDTRGNFFNKAANDKAGRSLEGYLRGEIGDDGDAGFKYLRTGRFTSYIVCEFYDKVTRKEFLLGMVFDLYKDSDIERNFFYVNGKMPENQFINAETKTPYAYKELKSFLVREYGNKNIELYSSNTQYQDALRGKFGGLNYKFFNLFKKAVTFTPIDDIEKFIVEYVCDVKNKIDITSMQENIRQYNSLAKQVENMKIRESELQTIERIHNNYIEESNKLLEEQFLTLRAEKQIIIDNIENLKNEIENKKIQQEKEQEEYENLKIEKEGLEEELNELRETKAKSDIEAKRKEIYNRIESFNSKIKEINDKETKIINYFRNSTLKWNANVLKLEEIKSKIIADEVKDLNTIKDLLKYLDNIDENSLKNVDIKAIEELKLKIENLKSLGNTIYFKLDDEYKKDIQVKTQLEDDISNLKKGRITYDSELINFKLEIEKRLKEKLNEEVSTSILADLLEIKDTSWQNAIEGYLNTQKKYLIIEPKYFEEASKIYRELAKNNEKIHSFGIVDIEKAQKENSLKLKNSLADEILTKNDFARIYIDYLLGKVIKCEKTEELRENKISITADCMLYHGYVLKKINPKTYKYPLIGKDALEKQKVIKEKELEDLNNKINNEETIIQVMEKIKDIQNFSDKDLIDIKEDIEKIQEKQELINEKQKLQDELDGMDMLWLNSINEKIEEKEKIRKEKERLIENKSNHITEIRKEIQISEIEKIPQLKSNLEIKQKEIDEHYNIDWQEEKEDLFGKICLNKTVEKIKEEFYRKSNNTNKRKIETKEELIRKRNEYNNKYQYPYNIYDDSNKEFSDELKNLKEIELPKYSEKIEDSRKKAYEQFRIEFLDKLKSNIDEVKSQIKDLNNALGAHRFGTDIYKFEVKPKQEYKRFYDMITDPMLLGDWFIGADIFNKKYEQEIKELFNKITSSNSGVLDEEYEKNIKEFTDYRTYLRFDLIVTDRTGNQQRLSKTLQKKSGGETQTPFYISILASFAQLYRINNNDNTIRLIVFDEAFSKMDSERIEESIKLLRSIGFQSIFAAPPEKLQDIQGLVDKTLLVLKSEEANRITVRNYTNKKE